MKRDIKGDKNDHFNNEKFPHDFSHDLGSQPRKSDARARKSMKSAVNSFDGDDEKFHHSHRNEPNKNLVRVQLRRIERLF